MIINPIIRKMMKGGLHVIETRTNDGIEYTLSDGSPVSHLEFEALYFLGALKGADDALLPGMSQSYYLSEDI